jgi:hypothetical protein
MQAETTLMPTVETDGMTRSPKFELNHSPLSIWRTQSTKAKAMNRSLTGAQATKGSGPAQNSEPQCVTQTLRSRTQQKPR